MPPQTWREVCDRLEAMEARLERVERQLAGGVEKPRAGADAEIQVPYAFDEAEAEPPVATNPLPAAPPTSPPTAPPAAPATEPSAPFELEPEPEGAPFRWTPPGGREPVEDQPGTEEPVESAPAAASGNAGGWRPRPTMAERLERLTTSSAPRAGGSMESGPTTARAAGAAAEREAFRLESWVGARLFMVIGALVCTIAVALFVQLAVQSGWLSFPPAARCMLGAGFGVLLLIAGEVALRRINALASASLSAAGIGALYVSSYAAYAMYSLVPAPVDFGLLVACCAIGVAIAARAGLFSVAAVSIIGGYMTPLLLANAPAQPLVLPLYLLGLLGVGLSLAGWRPQTFRRARPLVWWGTVLLMTPWVLFEAEGNALAALVFLASAWAAVHGELVWSGGREGLAVAPVLSPREARSLVTSFSTTAWAAGLGIFAAWRGEAGLPDWGVALAYAVATGGLAAWLAMDLRILRGAPADGRERLATVLAAQSAGLVIATIALAISGWAQIGAWLALGVAAAAAGRRLAARPLLVYGFGVLLIGLGRLMVTGWWTGSAAGAAWRVGGLFLTADAGVVGLAAAAWIAYAWIVRGGPARVAMLEPLERAMAGLGTGFGVACAMLAFVHEQASGAAVVVVWLAISALVLALNRVQSHARLDVFGLGALGATVLAWLASPVREGWGAPSETAMHLPSLWIGLGIFWLWIAALRWRDVIRARLSGDVIAGAVFPAVMLVMGAEAGLLLSLRWWAGAGESAARIGGLVLTPGATMAGVAAAAWIAAAWLVRGGRKRAAGLPMEERVLAEIATGAGLALAMLALVHEQANGAVVCLAWLAISAAVLALNRVQSHARLEWYGMAALGATLLCWLAVFGNRGWFESAAPAVLHPGLWLAFGIVAVAAGAARFRAAIRARFPAELLIGVAAACVVLLFTATSLEVARVAESAAADIRARKAAVSVWWGLFAIGLIAGGFWWRIPAARYAGLGLLAFATGKALVYDMLNASPGLRVASLVGLGLFMMGVAVAYSRLSARFGGPGTERRTADEE